MNQGTETTNDADLNGMESRSEKIRSDLASTVDELKNRLAPSTIRDDIKNEALHRGQDLLAKLQKTVQENPLQTAAVVAGLAFPAWNIVRNIPAPVLLMGAGVALIGRQVPSHGGGHADISPGTASHLNDTLAAKAAELGNSASAAAHEVSDQIRGLASDAVETVSSAAAKITTTVSSIATGTSAVAADLTASASNFASSAYADGTETVSNTGRRAVSAGRQGRETFLETVDKNPLLMGGLMALAGAALAAFIPVTRTENRVVGDASDRVKERVTSYAKEAAHMAKEAGERVVSETLDAAEKEGLTSGAAKDAVKNMAAKATAVIDTSLEAIAPDSAANEPIPRDVPRPA